MKHKLQALVALVLLTGFASPLWAQECAVTVESNDAMQYDTDRIEIPKSCSEFTVTLKHVGQLPEAVMGHNIVVTTAEDMQAVNTDGIKAGLENDYVKPDDERVIAHSEIIGGGESTEMTIPVSELQEGGSYMFFCSFPGHATVMKGEVVLQ